jgi:tight adherence protein B
MGSMIPKSLIFLLVFCSVSLIVWAATILVTAALKDYEKRFVSATSSTLSGMFIFMDPHKLFIFNIVITILFLVIGLVFTRNPVYLVLFGAVGFSIPKILIWRAKRKRFEKFAGQLVDSLTVLSNSLRAGLNIVQAIEVLESEQEPPISQEFGLVLREIKLGVPVADALKNLTKRIPNDDLLLMVASTNIVLGMGGNLREIFDSMADVIRERSKIEMKTKALTSQGKLQGLIVGLLPTALGVLMFIMDPPMMARMVTTTTGNLAIAAMFTMQIIGYLLIKRITTIEV